MADQINTPVQAEVPVQTSYSVKTGIWKTIKNVAVVFGVPALAFLVDNYTKWIPTEYVTNPAVVIIIAGLAYFVKNLIENHPAFQ